MSKCKTCQREMRTADGCTPAMYEYADGEAHLPIRYGQERRHQGPNGMPPERCDDCRARLGHYHHPGCDMEDCPRCGRQAITCGCGEWPEGAARAPRVSDGNAP